MSKARPSPRTKSAAKVSKFRRPASLTGALSEIGHSSLRQRNGRIDEEFLPELKGRNGIRVYKEMITDENVGAILFAVSMLIRQAGRKVAPFEEENASDKTTAEFVDSCFDDMSHSWQDGLTEILTMLPYGWALTEVVFKKRTGTILDSPGLSSKYSDGLYGWRKIALRPQDSLDKWEFDTTGGIKGMWQKADGMSAPRFIPITKSLLFRTESTKNNPEGRSILRTAYRPYYFKKRIQEIEGIGVERDLNGLPVIQPGEGVDLWDANNPDMVRMKLEAERIVQNIRNDEQAGVVLPFGWELTLLSTEGTRSFDTSKIIDRYSTSMAMTVLADFIALGHNNRYGSFALAGAKTHMFGLACGGWLSAISEVLNRYAIPRLLAINGMDIARPPKMSFTDIEIPDLDALGKYIYNLRKAGFKMFPNVPLEKKLLTFANLPTEGLLLGQEGDPVDTDPKEDEDDEKETKPKESDRESE